MGIKNLKSFFTLHSNYRGADNTRSTPSESGIGFQVHNLFLDMTAFIRQYVPEICEDDRAQYVINALDRLLELCNPQNLVCIAIDGRSPAAKDSTSRKRKNDREKDYLKALKRGEKNVLNLNLISSGSKFMEYLTQRIEQWILKTLKARKNLTFIFSDAMEPGEGEAKIFDILRLMPSNQTNVIYGEDSDFYVYGFSIPDTQIYLLHGLNKKRYELVDIGLMKTWVYEMMDRGRRLPKQRLLDDFVFLTTLIGNDFIVKTSFSRYSEIIQEELGSEVNNYRRSLRVLQMIEDYQYYRWQCDYYLVKDTKIFWGNVNTFINIVSCQYPFIEVTSSFLSPYKICSIVPSKEWWQAQKKKAQEEKKKIEAKEKEEKQKKVEKVEEKAPLQQQTLQAKLDDFVKASQTGVISKGDSSKEEDKNKVQVIQQTKGKSEIVAQVEESQNHNTQPVEIKQAALKEEVKVSEVSDTIKKDQIGTKIQDDKATPIIQNIESTQEVQKLETKVPEKDDDKKQEEGNKAAKEVQNEETKGVEAQNIEQKQSKEIKLNDLPIKQTTQVEDDLNSSDSFDSEKELECLKEENQSSDSDKEEDFDPEIKNILEKLKTMPIQEDKIEEAKHNEPQNSSIQSSLKVTQVDLQTNVPIKQASTEEETKVAIQQKNGHSKNQTSKEDPKAQKGKKFKSNQKNQKDEAKAPEAQNGKNKPNDDSKTQKKSTKNKKFRYIYHRYGMKPRYMVQYFTSPTQMSISSKQAYYQTKYGFGPEMFNQNGSFSNQGQAYIQKAINNLKQIIQWNILLYKEGCRNWSIGLEYSMPNLRDIQFTINQANVPYGPPPSEALYKVKKMPIVSLKEYYEDIKEIQEFKTEEEIYDWIKKNDDKVPIEVKKRTTAHPKYFYTIQKIDTVLPKKIYERLQLLETQKEDGIMKYCEKQ